MTLTTEPESSVTVQSLSLPEELLLALLNEESGYFHQVPGWNLNCAMAGAALAELSLIGRIDTDLESLILLDATETGHPLLDPILREIAAETDSHSARYWVERLAQQSEEVISQALTSLVRREILDLHPGEFYTFTKHYRRGESTQEYSAGEFVQARLTRIIFADEIPDPRDAVIVALVNACDVFHLMYQIDDELEQRIELVCKMDLIGRAIGDAVSESIAAPILQRTPLTKPIPRVPLRKMLLNRHLRAGRLPAFFASLAEEYGPVYKVPRPFQDPLIVLAGMQMNRWVHRQGRLYLRSSDYFQGVNEVYGSARSIHSMDGADHFRYRKAIQPAYARSTLVNRLDETYANARTHMSNWRIGDAIPAQRMLRPLMNAQVSPLLTSTHTQDLIDDVLKHKMRVLNVALANMLPNFMLRTPKAKRRAKVTDRLVDRILQAHTPGQRLGKPRDVVDNYLSLHASDPQFLPQTDLGVPMGTMLMASMYMGNQLGFALYWLVSNPDLYERVTAEADALFADGDPTDDDLNLDSIDVTHRVLMEALRMSPIVPMAMRTVMNSVVVEGYQLPVGASVYIANTAPHYMEEVFPDPWTFDIDRYAAPRNEHVGEGYSPYGLGTHSCLGFRWSELHLALNMLMLVHYFKIDFARPYKELPMDPYPSQSPSNKLKFRLAEQRHELPV
ncbi:MAG: cytochrome P450 [Chloroflexi bacterium]|nr:cytochrome P450 [Chloroflexota bacterium]